jgi:3'5'-cyclic nucleotide phosphodiesterase
MSVKTVTALAANKLGKFLSKDFRRIFGPAHGDIAERLSSLARSTIEGLGRSDALYHNFEHTLQVTMVGRDILQGMTLSQRIEPADYSHLIVACLLHDIGYMRGVLGNSSWTVTERKSRCLAAHLMRPLLLIMSIVQSCLRLSDSENQQPLTLRVSRTQLK